MKSKLLYVEHKSGYADNGPAWIGKGIYSKSGRTIYFNGQAFQSMKGSGISSNHFDLDTSEEYWISGIKKNEENRHWAGSGKVMIDRSVIGEYLKFIGKKEIDISNYEIIEFSKNDIISKTHDRQNKAMDLTE